MLTAVGRFRLQCRLPNTYNVGKADEAFYSVDVRSVDKFVVSTGL